MTVARVRMRGLRELPLERLLFIVVLGCSVLLLSVVMIRSEQATGVTKAAPRTFRDGFIVAQAHDVRRTESNDTTVLVPVLTTATGHDSDKTKPNVETNEKKTGTQVQVEQQGEHTMTKIKTEDGDEITIKRATNSKKITTISAHEDGKITIENRKEDDETKQPSNTVVPVNEEATTTKKAIDDEATRRAGYEKIKAPGKTKPATLIGDAVLLGVNEEPRPRRIEVEAPEQAKDVEQKKVTVVEVSRSLTKVRVQDVVQSPSGVVVGKGNDDRVTRP